jgi:hypothetical protein
VGPEAFYATATQVLPTILIALAVEIGFMMRIRLREQEVGIQRSMEGKPSQGGDFAWYEASMARWGLTAVGVGAAFLVGEMAAILALAFRWFNAWTFVPVVVCQLAVIVALAVVALIRLNDLSQGIVE